MATLVEAPEDVVLGLERKIRAEETSLPEKYRCLFSLRNVAGTSATKSLLQGEKHHAALDDPCILRTAAEWCLLLL